jgi:hypothetical protein
VYSDKRKVAVVDIQVVKPLLDQPSLMGIEELGEIVGGLSSKPIPLCGSNGIILQIEHADRCFDPLSNLTFSRQSMCHRAIRLLKKM